MRELYKYYLVKLVDDPTRKPRLYQSKDGLAYGDKVITWNIRADIPTATENAIYKKLEGYIVGTIECSKNTIKNLLKQVGGYYPLAKCERYQPTIVDREDYDETTFYALGTNEPYLIVRRYGNGVVRSFDVRKDNQ